MALPPLNLSGLATPTGATVSRKEVSSGIRRLLAESQRAAQTRDLLVEEIASGALPAGAAQQVARNAQALGRTGRAFAQDAVTRANYEAATAGRGKKIAGALLSAGGTVLAQALSMRGEDGEATTAGMDKAFEEEISPGDLTVPGGPAARLQAEAARQAERSQFGVPALTVDPSVLAAPGRVGSVQSIDPRAPAGATSPSLTGEYYVSPQALEDARLRQGFVNQEGLTEPRSLFPMYSENLQGRLPSYTAPRAIPAREGVPVDPILNSMSPDLRDEALAIQPRPAESGFGAAGLAPAAPASEPDGISLLDAAMKEQDEKKRKKLMDAAFKAFQATAGEQ